MDAITLPGRLPPSGFPWRRSSPSTPCCRLCDLSLSIGMNSATQVALFAAPIVVVLGWAVGQPMNLVFTPYELLAMVASVLVINHMAADGETNWLEGAQLLAVYVIIVTAFYYIE